MAIRYDKKFNQEINKIIRNYNAKIKRISKYEDSFNYQLPELMSKKNLKQNVYTRNELKRKLNELKRYSTRGIEKSMQLEGGYILSRYEYENLKREKARIQRNLSREIKRLESEKPRVYGKEQFITFAQMGDPYYLTSIGRKKAVDIDYKKLTSEEFKKYKQMIYKIGRSQEYETSLFRDNYKKMLFDLAYYTNYDKEKINYLNEKIDKLNNKKFYKLFHTEKGIKAITEYYVAVIGKKMKRIDPDTIRPDVWQNYDNLIENIEQIISSL